MITEDEWDTLFAELRVKLEQAQKDYPDDPFPAEAMEIIDRGRVVH